MICDKVRKRKKRIQRRVPKQRTHGKIIVLLLPDSKLVPEVIEGKEGMRSIEFFVILTVTAFYFAVMSGSVRLDQLVTNTKILTGFFEKGQFGSGGVVETVGEFETIVCLDTFDQIRELLKAVPEKDGRGISAALIERFEVAESRVFVNHSVLIELLTLRVTDQANRRDMLDVDLYPLTGIKHLLIRLWDILGIRKFHSHLTGFCEDPV